jgi:hypothetical protein
MALAGRRVTNVVSKVFIRGMVAHAGKDGERVFVNDGQVFPLGIPLTVGMTPIELGGGWRLGRRSPRPPGDLTRARASSF